MLVLLAPVFSHHLFFLFPVCRRSRAVFVELTQYNPAMGLQAVITLRLEFPVAKHALPAVAIGVIPPLPLSGGITLQLLMMVSSRNFSPTSLFRAFGWWRPVLTRLLLCTAHKCQEFAWDCTERCFTHSQVVQFHASECQEPRPSLCPQREA